MTVPARRRAKTALGFMAWRVRVGCDLVEAPSADRDPDAAFLTRCHDQSLRGPNAEAGRYE